MKKFIPAFLLAFLLTSCNGWVIQPLPGPTPFLPPTFTPSVYTATPVIIGVPSATPVIETSTLAPTSTNAPTTIVSDTPTLPSSPTLTASPSGPAVLIKVLGCNTGIDITHGMGEVTNAFVTLTNIGGVELTNIKATLYALDEGRVHPDKTAELTSLPIGYEVTVKLTVDSTYKQASPIQVEVTSDQGTFPREGLASCRDIGVLEPDSDTLKTPVPVQ